MSKKLYVLTVISNPQQYRSRYRLYNEFAKYMATHPEVEFYTVEHAFRDRPHVVTQEGNPYHVQVRGNQEFWHKENLLNIGIAHLPEEAEKIAWVDADVRFLNPNWVQDTLDALDHYKFVQMFSEYSDLGPNFEVLSKATSFVHAMKNQTEPIVNRYGSGRKGATGLAWAATRQSLHDIGGIPDYNIVGAGDWFLAYTLVGMGKNVMPKWATPGYKMLLENLMLRSERHIAGSVGYVKGSMIHYFHGRKSQRGYGWREKILEKYNYDPIADLTKDKQGLYILNQDKQGMLNELVDYFRSRDEDSLVL